MTTQAAPEKTQKERHFARWQALKDERNTWLPHWQQLAEAIKPHAFRYLETERNRGSKKNQAIINGTPIFAERTAAAGMMAGITSPSRPWFRLGTHDDSLSKSQAVKVWLEEVEKKLYGALAKSNLYNALHEIFSNEVTFGTVVLHLDEDDEDYVRGYVFPIGQYALGASRRLAIEAVYRNFQMTVRQLVQEFGFDACCESTRNAYRNGQLDQPVSVLHVIEPNDTWQAGAIGPKGKKFLSCHYELTSLPNEVLRVSGYEEQPFCAPRWSVTGEDVYGRCPGMDALGDCRSLQVQERRSAQMTDKIVSPPMKGPSSLRNARTSLLPGDMTYVDALAAGQTFAPAMEVNPMAVQVAEAKIQRTEHRINQAFYADLWLMLAQADGNMTAREVVERKEEKLLMLGPVLERLQDELLDPMLERLFFILLRAGQLPPPPQELQGLPLAIEYISIMAQAQKLLGTTGIERLVAFVLHLAAGKPEALDKLAVDQVVEKYAEMLGVPPSVIVTNDVVAALRKARAKQQQQVAALQQVQAGAATAKDLAQAPTDENNALTTMLRSYGAA